MMKPFSLVLCFLLYSSHAVAWGGKGHKIVADIVKSRLSQKIIDSVNHYLDVAAWGEAACWMDEVSHDKDRPYNFMKPWHYVDIPKDKTYVKTKTPNLINELEFIITALHNRKKYPREKITMYLKILMHLMGDLHQPLHCGYPNDRGGNDVLVVYMEKLSNLHKVWDSGIINAKHIDENDCLKMIKTWSPEQINKLKQASIMDCVAECRNLLPQVYEASSKINGKYATAAAAIIKSQLSKAGLRLQAALELIFSK